MPRSYEENTPQRLQGQIDMPAQNISRGITKLKADALSRVQESLGVESMRPCLT